MTQEKIKPTIEITFDEKDNSQDLKLRNVSGEQIVIAYMILQDKIEKETGMFINDVLKMRKNMIEAVERKKNGKQ